MARGTKVIDLPEVVRVRTTVDQKVKAEKKAKRLGYATVSAMIRAFLDEPISA